MNVCIKLHKHMHVAYVNAVLITLSLSNGLTARESDKTL